MAHVAHGEDVCAEMMAHLADIEAHLSDLDKAFACGEGETIAHQCEALQRSLAASLVAFRKAEHVGIAPLSNELRARLKLAQSRVLAQQAAVFRAHGSIERTLNVLLPHDEAASSFGSLGSSPAARALKAYR